MAAYLITVVVLVIYIVLVWFIGSWLHLSAAAALVLRLLLWLIGLIAAGAFVWFYRKNRQVSASSNETSDAGGELDQRVNEALRQLRMITRAPRASFGDHPLVLVLGPTGTTKTSVIRNSGLDPDLLSGQVEQDGTVVPTRTANLFFTRQAVFVDVGGRLEAADLNHLFTRLQRSSLAGALRFGAQQPRIALVCLGCDAFQQGTEVMAAHARTLNAALHELAQVLGSDCAVYVLFTKMDRVPGFSEYVQYLSKEEAAQVLGVTLPLRRSGTGVYAEDESKRLSTAFDELFYSLAEKRTEFLAHANDAAKLGAIYEFPRHFRKMRTALVQFLVDLCRPSHMPNNPLLRGFYFCGVRPIVVEDVMAPAVESAPVADAGSGATRMFSFDQVAAAAPRAAQIPVARARKVPQWAFVTHLFSDVLLKDHTGMAASGFSSKINVVRRALLTAACVLLLVSIASMFNSWLGNRALQRTVAEAAGALSDDETTEPSLAQLEQLERLRSTVATLEQHRREGAPWGLRWGLYSGDALYPEARKLYFSRFRALLFGATRQRMVEELRALPSETDEAHDYATEYAVLKAYVITTGKHEKSDKGFLVPVLYSRWAAGRQVDDARAQLIQMQFAFYADSMVPEDPFPATADGDAIANARAYLRRFSDEDRMYQAVLAEAAKHEPIDFNRLFPGSATVVVSDLVIPGAFTKAGFITVQNRFNNLQETLGREEWVLGGPVAGSIAGLEARLHQRYAGEFVEQWRRFLRGASVREYASYADAANKLELLVTPSYPLLALFAVVSDNTNVDAPEVAAMFRAVHAVVAPAATSPVQPANQDYLKALGELRSAMQQAALAPPDDPTAAAQVRTAVGNANGVPEQMLQAVYKNTPKRVEEPTVNRIDRMVLALLKQPIQNAEGLAGKAPANALNAAGRAFCEQFSRISNKYPFNPTASEEASLEEVGNILAPAPGKALFDFYNGTLQKYLIKQGSQYIAPQGSAVQINRRFLDWFNLLVTFSDALYPRGPQQPQLVFSLNQSEKNREFKDLSITVHGERLSGGLRQFTWPGKQPGIVISERGDSLITFEGPWALFRFAAEANWMTATGAAELEFHLKTNNRPQKFPSGNDKVVYYELRMSNPRVLQRDQLAGMGKCVPRVTGH